MDAPAALLVIDASDIRKAMGPADWLEAAERAFRAAAEGKAASPQPMHIEVPRGGFHVKAASISLERNYVAVKVNGNFPGNPDELGLPTVQGATILADGSNGTVLAILDSIEVTLKRTAAASALAAKVLALPESATLLVCGCGAQGRAHVAALKDVLPLARILFWDRIPASAEALAREQGGEVVDGLRNAALSADVIACCTSSKKPFLHADMVKPGTFVAAVGADHPEKNEIAPELMVVAAVVADSLRQCAAMGDLHHAIAAGVMAEADVRGELADVLTGAAPGRSLRDEIVVFDSTGTGLLDVAATAAIYERAIGSGLGQAIALARLSY
jgi:ornithine cyclodeaminase/alanine dehydrogenase-like protein (mu-crystallin family)